MVKVLFYHWDWKAQPEIEAIQRAVDAVFDGNHAPRIVEVKDADWDQETVAITSVPFRAEVIRTAFNQYLADDSLMYWWEEKNPPTPFETA